MHGLEQNLVAIRKEKGTNTDTLALKQSNASLTALQQKLKDLQSQNNGKSNAIKQLESKYTALEAQNETINKTKYQLQNQYTRIDKELADLKAVNENLKGRYELLSEQYQQAQDLSLIHIPSPRDRQKSRMPSSA